MNPGVLPGDICDRNGCKGILYERNTEGLTYCTCFLGHPPCSYCVTMVGCCPDCGWNEEDSKSTRFVLFEKCPIFKYRSRIRWIVRTLRN